MGGGCQGFFGFSFEFFVVFFSADLLLIFSNKGQINSISFHCPLFQAPCNRPECRPLKVFILLCNVHLVLQKGLIDSESRGIK